MIYTQPEAKGIMNGESPYQASGSPLPEQSADKGSEPRIQLEVGAEARCLKYKDLSIDYYCTLIT